MGKKKVGKRHKEHKNNVKGNRPKESDAPLSIDFSNKYWMKSVSLNRRDYTNKLQDEKQFAKYITDVFFTLIPTVLDNWSQIKTSAGRGSWRHCHPLEDEKLDLAMEIVKEIYDGKFDELSSPGPTIWQLGVVSSIRFICIYDYTKNIITPLFIDYHHLIYPDVNFNDPDYDKYPFCPIDTFQ